MNNVMKRILMLSHMVCVILVNCSFLQVKESGTAEMFSQYKNLFTQIDLPIDWDMCDIGKFGMPSYGIKSAYAEIPSKFSTFIPDDIIQSDSVTYIRALYQLPSKGDVDVFLIATDYMYDRYREGELHSIITQLYLIAYNNSGTILFYTMIAGTAVDEWEQLVQINADYAFQTKHYRYLYETVKHPQNGHILGKMRYTKTMGEIRGDGIINYTSDTITGYFDSTQCDYELIIMDEKTD